MFKVEFYQYYLGNRCRPYFFWNVCPKSFTEKLWRFCSKCLICSNGCLPYIYWMVLGLSITGAWQSLQECKRVLCCPSPCPTLWRHRKFFVIPVCILRKTRVVASIFMSYTWLLMIYALITVKPEYMAPWMFVNSMMLLFDSILWIIEVVTGHCALELRTLVAMTRLACTLILVKSVRNAFEYAIINNRAYSLRVTNKGSILRQPF